MPGQVTPLNLINFGRTVSCTFDLAPVGVVYSGVQVLSEALVRRLLTPNGRLLDDRDYGYEIIQHVNDDMNASDVAQVGSEIDLEFLKDPRVTFSSTQATFNVGTLTTVSAIQASSGPFNLVLFLTPAAVPFLVYQILRAGAPVPPPAQAA